MCDLFAGVLKFNKMLCMHTAVKTNSGRLHRLTQGVRLSQPIELTLFNWVFSIQRINGSAWKGYFCDLGTTRYRSLNDEWITHAARGFFPYKRRLNEA